MADKSNQLMIDALARAVADPAGMPLYTSKAIPGLFAATGAAKVAAQRCKDAAYLRVVRTETRGKTALEICSLTGKGLSYLLEQVSPKQVLEDLVRALEGQQHELTGLVNAARESQASLDALRITAEVVLKELVTSRPAVPTPNEMWQKFQGNGATPATDDNAILKPLEQWHAAGATEDCPLPELYRRARETAPQLTLGQFHDVLRRLHQREQVYLHPWTGPLYDLPEPPLAFMVGHEIAYYASVRR